ncbi:MULTISPECIES: DUF4956 domain-containing protein [Rhodococcus]|jgi:hypothetical protein|uniref:DUF4956 domain-containing protein n=1 Tax=Rhodococcus TaxID=1827 RepID=UPI000B5A6A1E|nr:MULTISPECIES: DUF4956 domain-containing protein [Rhodococcus]MXQ75139.1 DUF4956 domain-containing protein [Rhodococcus rhodochrous]OWY81645.1 DUF4956 domain-containing protein [Rhodococcus sp. BUPNP1]QHG82197.1 DUF4956 domain-containing protein [Rhodococcus rhodochrous]QOH58130.1 DUF4956 domain-containing protein [Rhodococcus rhodochrous]QXF82787.1 DUF4956 domain-containing protein [Rhodococcus pyridinivorans]
MNFDFQDLSGTFTTFDIVVSLALSFVLSSVIAWVYRYTHKNVSYSQSYVQTLVLVGMVIALIMLVVGSNIARAFALVGALSVVRFRNAIKETRDVGFIFLVMAIGMTTGTRFYVLAIAATVAICLVLLIMNKFNWFKLDVQRQVVKVQVPPEPAYTSTVEDVLIKHCSEYELVSTESVRAGALVELYYTAQLKKGTSSNDLIAALSAVNAGQRVSVLTGYDQTDL